MTKQPQPRSEPRRQAGGKATLKRIPKARRADKARQCLVTREQYSKSRLIRFVVGPDATIVPDIAEKLPGKGLWVLAQRDCVDAASQKQLFSKAAKQKTKCPEDLADLVENRLVRRSLDGLGLAAGAGHLVFGAEKTSRLLRDGGAAILIEATDGRPDGRRKMMAALHAGSLDWCNLDADNKPLVAGCFSRDELSLALGRENVIHAALKAGGFARRLRMDLGRLDGFRPLKPKSWAEFGAVAAQKKPPPNNATVSDA